MRKSYIKYFIFIILTLFNQSGMTKSPDKVLLFFHAGYCHYCEGVAASLVDIEKKHGLKIVANGLDKKVLPQFANYIKNDDLIRKFKIGSVPTLIAIDFATGQYETLIEHYEEFDVIDAKVLAWINNA